MADGFTSAVGLGLQMHVPCGRRRVAGRHLYPDDLGALLVQLCCVLLMCLLLALQWLGVMLVTGVIQDASKSPLHKTSLRPTSHHWAFSRETGCVLTSSRPSHLWSSNRRCLPQKWPSQKPQSPTILCAGSLQSAAVHLSFLGAMLMSRDVDRRI